ncbi:hypothetical protein BJ085DRAFT_42520 [Dimargaris cristalligena]|uniref:Uncharacterized protein n=1 Tax=Dimargaris cristalligena TaxID=215637 RepID=A0A4P9ZXS8_9FUNG|nr:hypothetical protein BJ085DRAFT_42520 [Dimargaris cristalligena]|eukprot:RKP37550.1 hypothetical protein BJ085DRAFT_42520 [Dimargaris cristalligena]
MHRLALSSLRPIMKFIDIGANLTDPVFRGLYRGKRSHPDDFDHVLARAQQAGVDKIIVTGGSLSESREALDLAKNHDSLFSTVGCHPTRCSEFEQKGDPERYFADLQDVIQSDQGNNVVAIGECGLGREYFEKQIALAESTGLPMFLHNRNTGQGVVHSFTGPMDELKELLTLDLYIGINGCSLKTQENIDAMLAIPEDRLLIETDAPWCDIRPTHASHAHLTKSDGSGEWTRITFESKKKERFVEGQMVKGRNEPCTIQDVMQYINLFGACMGVLQGKSEACFPIH